LHDVLAGGDGNNGFDTGYVIDVILGIVRSALESKADGIAFINKTVVTPPPELLRCFRKVRKLADFYSAAFLVFNLPGSESHDTDSLAHCVFNLPPPGAGIGPVSGQPGIAEVANNLSFTTAGDVPGDTAIESLKKLLQSGQ
jgi:hypothetical protein